MYIYIYIIHARTLSMYAANTPAKRRKKVTLGRAQRTSRHNTIATRRYNIIIIILRMKIIARGGVVCFVSASSRTHIVIFCFLPLYSWYYVYHGKNNSQNNIIPRVPLCDV
uniref:Uncharacterized protein n=1 Tax=Schizaphis graminum TaxID=13262 RepID=A0A2S2NVI1_SCHGA